MNTLSTLKQAVHRLSRRRNKSAETHRRRLSMESLEGRKLMAASWGLSGTTLNITADAQGSQVTVRDLNLYNQPNAAPLIYVSTTSSNGSWAITLPKQAVQHVSFVGSNVKDEFYLDTGFRFNGIYLPNPGSLTTMISSRIEGRGGDDILNGSRGDDVILGGFGMDTVDGKDGNDTIYGEDESTAFLDGQTTALAHRFGAADVLHGGNGNDTIHGGGGNDRINGGAGKDHLYGGYGNDVIHGDAGNDHLYGQIGHDDLYGDADIDALYGGSEADGLYGGYGLDLLNGGTGADRILVHNSTALSYDVVDSLESRDAVVYFRDGVTEYKLMGSNIGWVQAVGATWAEDDIEMVDGALKSLHMLVGNTRLLETAVGESSIVERYGTVWNARQNADGTFTRLSTVNTTIGGWNDPGSPAFAITQNRFDDGVDEVHRVVFHELGHNWDEQSENAFTDEFRAVAGWRDFTGLPAPTTGYERAQDTSEPWNDWYFLNRDSGRDGFARSYGKMNPLEDFATSFAAFMMTWTNRNYFGESPATTEARLEDRFDVLYTFLGQMGASNRSDWPV